jgi:hypothetical protein
MLALPPFQGCGDGDDNDAGPLLPSFRDLGLVMMTMLAPSLGDCASTLHHSCASTL